jgi:hypothetical protein
MLHFPVTSVKRVKIGPGWARNWLWLLILPYVAGINKMSEGHAVSFEAPAGDAPGDAAYAFHMHRGKRQRSWLVCSGVRDRKTRSRQSDRPTLVTRDGQRSV